MHPTIFTSLLLLLITSLIKYSEQGAATCNNATLVKCTAPQAADLQALVDMTAKAFCSDALAFSSCISDMNCQSSDTFSTDGGYFNAKASADQYTFLCTSSNLAVWAANSQCIVTVAQSSFMSCSNALGVQSVSPGQYCTFYQSLFQCIFNQASQQCNPSSAPLAVAMYFYGAKASMSLMGCTLTMPSTSTCTSCGFQCAYGINMGTTGCPVCSSGCINPCQNVQCQQNQACVPVCITSSSADVQKCTWTGTCVANTTQQCDAMAFGQCMEPEPFLPHTDPTIYCSKVNVYDRCLHSIGCSSSDSMYSMLQSLLGKLNDLKMLCAYFAQQGSTTFNQNLRCAINAITNSSESCSKQVTPPSSQASAASASCGYYNQTFQCLYNAVKMACNADVAKVALSQQLSYIKSLLSNSSISCTIATPWVSSCVSCSTTCLYGYVTDAIGCDDCNRCNINQCQFQTKACASGQTCATTCTNLQCTATCRVTNGGLSAVKTADAIWWKMALYLLFSTVAAAKA